jgi:hypothetical protein
MADKDLARRRAYCKRPEVRVRLAAAQQTRRKRNPEKNRAYKKTWRDKHLERERARERAFCAAHPEKIRAKRLHWKYGLSLAAFDYLLNGQGGVCAICGTSDWGGYGPVVDHDHIAGIVRGILCNRCNVAAGMIGDDPDRAGRLEAYLRGR